MFPARPWQVECLFFRYYSWRRRCSCSMYLPDRFGGWCNKQTGAIASMDKACSQCKKMDPNAYADCDNLPDGVQASLVQDTIAVGPPSSHHCDATQEDYCSMAHGKKVSPETASSFVSNELLSSTCVSLRLMDLANLVLRFIRWLIASVMPGIKVSST